MQANEIRQIRLLSEGEFDEKTLQKLVTKLGSNFEPFKPDKAVMQYLNQHTRQLGLDPPSFTHPKDKNNSSDKSERRKSSSSEKRKHRTDRSDRKRKRTDASDSKSKSDYKSKSRDRDKNKKEKVPFGEHCRRPSCKQRGTHTTHKYRECRYKDDDKTSSHKHPNLGKAPSKAKDHKSKGDTTSQASLPAATNNVRKCYTCGDPNHLANACPQKFKHKQNAKTKLKANKSFLALFKSSFSSQNEQACASRMIDAWDEEDICPSCIQPCFFAHECNPSDSHVTQHVPHVRQTIANSNLLQYIQEAHKPHTNRLQASNPVSLNMNFFLQAEGQDVNNTGELSPIRQHHDHRQSSDEDDTDNRSSSESGLRSSNEDDLYSDSASDRSRSASADDSNHSYNESPLYDDQDESDVE
jgi:hypothetical protein